VAKLSLGAEKALVRTPGWRRAGAEVKGKREWAGGGKGGSRDIRPGWVAMGEEGCVRQEGEGGKTRGWTSLEELRRRKGGRSRVGVRRGKGGWGEGLSRN